MERYLRRCLSSLVIDDEALMNTMEVLVINDGSTDSSSEIAHEYVVRFPEVFRVIDKENGYYGSCINRGIKEATGRYIKTLDADDYYDNEGLKGFLMFLQRTDADVAVHYCQSENAEGVRGDYHGFVPEYYEANYADKTLFTLEDIANVRAMHPHVYNMAYKTELLRNLRYEQVENIYYSDTQWRITPMAFVKTIEVYPYVVYRYFLGREGQSVSYSVRRKHFSHEVSLMKRLFEDYNNVQVSDVARTYLDNCILGHIYYLYKYSINNEQFDESDLRGLDIIIKESMSHYWEQMNGWRFAIHAYRHSVTVGFWRKWDGRWFYMLEGTLKFFWDPYKKLKKILKAVL